MQQQQQRTLRVVLEPLIIICVRICVTQTRERDRLILNQYFCAPAHQRLLLWASGLYTTLYTNKYVYNKIYMHTSTSLNQNPIKKKTPSRVPIEIGGCRTAPSAQQPGTICEIFIGSKESARTHTRLNVFLVAMFYAHATDSPRIVCVDFLQDSFHTIYEYIIV